MMSHESNDSFQTLPVSTNGSDRTKFAITIAVMASFFNEDLLLPLSNITYNDDVIV